MNLPIPAVSPESGQRPVISSHSILLMCGVLFGMAISGNITSEAKMTFVFAGTIGLIAFVGLSVMKRARNQTQQQVAIMHVEERLERHAQLDPRTSERVVSSPA